MVTNLHPWEEAPEVRCDNFFKCDKSFTVGHHNKSGKDWWNFQSSNSSFAGARVLDLHCQVEREIRNIRERMSGIHRQWCENREDLSLKDVIEKDAIVFVEITKVRKINTCFCEVWHKTAKEDLILS